MQPAHQDSIGSDRSHHRYWKRQHWKQVDLELQHSIRNCLHCCMGALAGFPEFAVGGFGERSHVDMHRYRSIQEGLRAVRCPSRWTSSCHLDSPSAVAGKSTLPVGFAGTEWAWVYRKESLSVGFLGQPRIGYCLPGIAIGFREDTVQAGRDHRSSSDD